MTRQDDEPEPDDPEPGEPEPGEPEPPDSAGTFVLEPTDVTVRAKGAGRATASPADQLPPDHRVGDYVVDAALGEGGFSTVYAAHHHRTWDPVALKVLHRRWCLVPQIVARFLREAQVVQRLEHPNIVALHEVGWLDGSRPFLVMEYLDGLSLGRLINQRGSLPAHEALAYFEPVCHALGAAHRSGIVHRDLKASNVMVSHPGTPFWVKLIDFGIAKLVAPEIPRLTRTGSQVGTMTAMSPEQIRGVQVDWRADIYALGVLLYQCVTGQRPFTGSPVAVEALHLNAPAPRASRIAPIGPALDRVILRCMEKDPDQRYLSTDTFLIALRTAVEEPASDPAISIRPVDEAAPGAAGAATAVAVVGLYAEVLVDGRSVDGDTLDDDTLDVIEHVVERIATRSHEDGHVLALRTSTAIMACRAPGEDGDERAYLARMISSARALAEEMRGRPAGSARIEVAMYLDVGEAGCGGDGASQTLSGPFIEARPWLPAPLLPGAWVSRDVAERVGDRVRDTAWCPLEDA